MPARTAKPKPPEVPTDLFDDEVEGESKEVPDDNAGIVGNATHATIVPEEPPVPEPTPIRAIATRPDAGDHHLVVGMATLANMTDEEFRAKLDVMKRGIERVKTIQIEVMKEGVDYGKVKGIEKPFLHQPGAELLSNLYGLAVEQSIVRITRQVGDDPTTPPFAYHVRSYVHLGDTSGPIVAEGVGEANPYEEKYHYRFAKQGCPICGVVGAIIRRKSPEQMAGKFQCMNYGGKNGCGSVFEPDDPRLGSKEKEVVPDADLYGLAETIVQMAAKRSLVSAIRRATGTSGLFTQDDDSPSVQRQSAETAPDSDGPPPVIETVTQPQAPRQAGGTATQVQHARLAALAKEKGMKGAQIAELVERLFGTPVERNAAAAQAAVKALTADALANLITFIEVGDTSSIQNGTASEETTEELLAQAWDAPEDVGAK